MKVAETIPVGTKEGLDTAFFPSDICAGGCSEDTEFSSVAHDQKRRSCLVRRDRAHTAGRCTTGACNSGCNPAFCSTFSFSGAGKTGKLGDCRTDVSRIGSCSLFRSAGACASGTHAAAKSSAPAASGSSFFSLIAPRLVFGGMWERLEVIDYCVPRSETPVIICVALRNVGECQGCVLWK